MNLPMPIQAYFDADRNRDREALTRVFGPDAVVEDEGRTHVGRQAIAAWWKETKEKYQTVMEPLETRVGDDATTVSVKVTGQFPGSPAVINFAFRLSGDQVASLKITA